MKKWLAAAVVFGMLFTVPVMADEDFSAADITVEFPKEENADFSFKDEGALAITPTSDVVSIDGNHITIDAQLFHYDVNLDPTMGLFALTQDYVASLANFWLYNDPEGVLNYLIENEIHLVLMGINGPGLYFHEFEGDMMAKRVGNLKGTPDDLLKAILDIYVSSGYTKGEIVKVGDDVWFLFDGRLYMTVIDSNYVYICWEGATPESVMSENDALDVQDILADITITSR